MNALRLDKLSGPRRLNSQIGIDKMMGCSRNLLLKQDTILPELLD